MTVRSFVVRFLRRDFINQMRLITRFTRRRFKGPADALKKGSVFARVNGFFGRTVISFGGINYGLGIIANPFRRKGIRDKFLYQPVIENEDVTDPTLLVGKNKFDLVLSFIEGRIGKNEKILDVGCNGGFNLGLLHDHGYTELYGIEPSFAAVNYAHEHRPYLKETVKQGFFGPKKNNVQAKLVMFMDSADRVPYNFGLFEAIDECASEYVFIGTGELWESHPRDWIYEMARKGFLCIEKQVVGQHGKPTGRQGIDGVETMGWSAFLFRRLGPNGAATRTFAMATENLNEPG